jgi:hypothetical protein
MAVYDQDKPGLSFFVHERYFSPIGDVSFSPVPLAICHVAATNFAGLS